MSLKDDDLVERKRQKRKRLRSIFSEDNDQLFSITEKTPKYLKEYLFFFFKKKDLISEVNIFFEVSLTRIVTNFRRCTFRHYSGNDADVLMIIVRRRLSIRII